MFLVIDKGDDVVQVAQQVEEAFKKHYSSSTSPVSGHVEFLWRPERWLLQVYGDMAGHGDIWFWQMSDDEATVYNPDFTFADLKSSQPQGYKHPTSWILPTKRMQWNGLDIPIAHDVDRVLENQFGSNFRVPYKNRLQCVENLYSKVYPDIRFFCYVLCLPTGTALLTLLYLIRGFRSMGKVDTYPTTSRHLVGVFILFVLIPTVLITTHSLNQFHFLSMPSGAPLYYMGNAPKVDETNLSEVRRPLPCCPSSQLHVSTVCVFIDRTIPKKNQQ